MRQPMRAISLTILTAILSCSLLAGAVAAEELPVSDEPASFELSVEEETTAESAEAAAEENTEEILSEDLQDDTDAGEDPVQETQTEDLQEAEDLPALETADTGLLDETPGDDVPVTEDPTEEEPVVIPITKISLNTTSKIMATKETLALKATVTPQDTTEEVLWTSSNPSVASVDANGKVTAKRYGKAVITASSMENPSVKATCEISTRYWDVNGSSDKKNAKYQYYYTPVYWAANKGITNGYDNVYFGPARNCQRRELMIFLWRYSGKPSATGSLPFTDVTSAYAKTSDTYKAILWGYKQGIVKGFTATQFRPTAAITRKDSLIMLYRLKGKPYCSGNLSFPDVVNKHYGGYSDSYQSILWAYYTGIANGYDDGSFKPEANCLREHIVTFLYRYANMKNTLLQLSTPKLTSCEPSGNNLVVRWNKVTNAKNYIVYRKNANGSLTKLATTTATSYTFKNANAGTTYTFTVVAKNGRLESDYDETGISASTNRAMALAAQRLAACGGTLRDAYNWAVGIPYNGSQPAVYHTYGYAEWSFDNLAGDCLGKAATFCLMARLRGYEARLMYGYVPRAGGGMIDHGWVEIKWTDGNWYLCDPDFEYETGRNGYFITYGQSGTWMKTDYYALPD